MGGMGGEGYFEQLEPKLAMGKCIEESVKENPILATLVQEKCIAPYTV